MKEYVKPLEIAAVGCMNNRGETVLTLYGDHGVPDVIFCDGKRYTQEPMVDRDALLKIADEMDEFPDCGDIRCGKEMPPLLVHRFACRIREACGK